MQYERIRPNHAGRSDKAKAIILKTGARRFKMDRSTEWPWNWEEEAEWKADLEEKEDDLLEELIEGAVEDGATGSSYVLTPPQEEDPAEDSTPEKYLVTA